MSKKYIDSETVLGKLLDGRYWIIKKCTSGGFGETYLAEDTRRPGNPVCFVKHLKPANNQREFLTEARRMFNVEAETIEKLGQHDQIPRLLAYFEQEEKFYLVQDFVQGHTLREELAKGDRWQESQVIQLLREVLPILEFIHSHGVIHRDLKPSNLIRRKEDNKLVIVDFGAVKLLRNRLEGGKNSNKSEITVGTRGYMPYEQAQGKPCFNSDIYALGAIAIQTLTKTKPSKLDFDPATNEMLWEHLICISPGLTFILNKMVRYDYKERYQSASEVLKELESAGLRNQVLVQSGMNPEATQEVVAKNKFQFSNVPRSNPPQDRRSNFAPKNSQTQRFHQQKFGFPAQKTTKPVRVGNSLSSAQPSQNSNFPKKLLLPIGIAISIATTWPIALTIYYLLWHLNIAHNLPNLPVFLPLQKQETE